MPSISLPSLGFLTPLFGAGTAAAAGGAGLGGLAAGGLGALGVGADTSAILGGALGAGAEGAAFGAGTSALTGGDPLKGAELGFATGGIGDLGGAALGGFAGPASTAATTAGPSAAGAVPAGATLPAGGASAASSSLSGSLPTSADVAGGGIGGTSGGVSADLSALTGTAAPATSGATIAGGGLTLPLQPMSAPLENQIPSLPAAAPAGGGWLTQDSGILGASNGQLLQGGLMGIQGLRQNAETSKLLGPLKSSAAQLRNESTALSGPLFGGNLPAGAKEAVDLATQSSKARIRSQYANLGLSGSTMEADALNQVDRQAAAQTFQMADQLLQTGLNATGMSDQLYSGILNATLGQNSELSSALGNFAAELMGAQTPTSGRTVTLNLGG